ncbi:hypothetical protein BH18THE2_BH18THE2_12380 [soil metagenome]
MIKNVKFIAAAIDIVVIYPEITINRTFAGVKQ